MSTQDLQSAMVPSTALYPQTSDLREEVLTGWVRGTEFTKVSVIRDSHRPTYGLQNVSMQRVLRGLQVQMRAKA